MKKCWPVPNSYSKKIPENGEYGAFKKDEWHDKLGHWHSGVDFLCPTGSKVIVIEDCVVIETGQFTGYPGSPQYRKTWFVKVKNGDGKIAVYGELRRPKLKMGQKLKNGQIVGYVARVSWTRHQPDRKKRSMLHFELYRKGTKKTVEWWSKNRKKPKNLLNPTNYLKGCKKL